MTHTHRRLYVKHVIPSIRLGIHSARRIGRNASRWIWDYHAVVFLPVGIQLPRIRSQKLCLSSVLRYYNVYGGSDKLNNNWRIPHFMLRVTWKSDWNSFEDIFFSACFNLSTVVGSVNVSLECMHSALDFARDALINYFGKSILRVRKPAL